MGFECACVLLSRPCVRASQSSSVEQLQVGDGYFASLAAPLAHEPVRVHAGDTAHCDDLVSQQGELTAAGGVVVVEDPGLAAAAGDAQLVEATC